MKQEQKFPGGLLVGETDKNGGKGIKIVAPEGNIIAGGGELVLTSDTGKSTDIHEFDGKKMTPCEIASSLNVDGGGVAIPCHIAEPANTTDSNMEVGDVIRKESGGNIGNDNLTELKNTLSKYGWTAKISEDGKYYQLINRNNKIVSYGKFKGDRYFFYDTIGNKLLSGMGELNKSAEKVATGYFYANLIGESETLKSNSEESASGGNIRYRLGGEIETIISKYNLWGRNIPLRFENDNKTYFSKNISADRKRIFVTNVNGRLEAKKISDIEYVQSAKVKFEDGGSMETEYERLKEMYPQAINDESMAKGGKVSESDAVEMMWLLKNEGSQSFNAPENIFIAEELVDRGLVVKEGNEYGLTKIGEQELMEKGGKITEKYHWKKRPDGSFGIYNKNGLQVTVRFSKEDALDYLKKANNTKEYEISNQYPVKKSKYEIGDKVYSWQNKDYPAEVVRRHFSPLENVSKSHENDTWKYLVRLKDGQRSKWMNESSLYKTKQKEYAQGGEIESEIENAARIEDADNKETQTCNCPTMTYYNRLTSEAKERLGERYIAEGTTIKDMKTGVVSDIVGVVHTGFNLFPQSNLDNAPRQEFFVPFEEIVDKHGRNLIEIGGYQNTMPDHKVLVLVIKDIIACNIIKSKDDAIRDKEADISQREDVIQDREELIRNLNDTIDNEVLEDVEVIPEMAHGGIIGEIKATRSGAVREVRDVTGKMLDHVYVGDTLYERNTQDRNYRNSRNDLLLKLQSTGIHMAYGGIVGVVEKPNYYFVDISSPPNAKTCKIPKWAQHAADSIRKGAKVTKCKKYGKWFTSSVLIPKDGITSNEAKHFAAEIRDLIDRKKMEHGGVMFQTGATTEEVDELILFTDNTNGLAKMRDAVYESVAKRIKNGDAPTLEQIEKRFFPLFIKSKTQYGHQVGIDLPLSPEDGKECMRIYAEEFPVWAKENYADYDKIKDGLSDIYGTRFERGGMMEEDSDKVAAHKYWDGLTKKQKLHFLLDHADYVYDKPASKLDKKVLTEYKKLSAWNWNKLPKEVQMAIEEHVIMGVYETGGEISGYTPLNEEQSKELIGDDVKSTVNGILVMIECTDDPEEKKALKEQLKQYDYKQN